MTKIQCICPARPDGETRHPDGDQVELRERLDFRSVVAIRNEVVLLKRDDPESPLGEVLAALTEFYLVYGVESWTLVDDDGPIEVTHKAVREHLLSDTDAAMDVGDAADAKYSAVMLPLLVKVSTSSQLTPTEPSTSPTTGSSPLPPTPLRPSSTSTSPTDDTETISPSPGGDSRSSRKSRLAG